MQVIFFDLDGTLTDPHEGITRCVAHAMTYYGVTDPDPAVLRRFIGPPLIESFQVYFGLSEADARDAVAHYRERFGPIGLFENEVYRGIPEALAALRARGLTLAVATSKPHVYANRIIEKFALAPYFAALSGSELDGRRTDKHEVIEEAIARLGADRASSIMVGDRKHDILGAKKSGLRSIGVRYGFAEEGELEAAGADIVVDTPAEIPDAVARLTAL